MLVPSTTVSSASNRPAVVDEFGSSGMERRKIRKNRTSLIANVLLFILGVLTFVFVDATFGGVLILLSIFLYGLYLWLTRRFARMRIEDEHQH